MNSNLRRTVRVVVAMACLALPLGALGATKAELMQKAQAHKALTAGKANPKAAAKKTDKQAAKQQVKALHSKKAALVQERRSLARQGDPAAREANHQKMAAVNAELRAAKKGGAQK